MSRLKAWMRLPPGLLKAMLQGMIQRGATIFLTSHVLEIVERLCSHVAIIHQGTAGGERVAGGAARGRGGTDVCNAER